MDPTLIIVALIQAASLITTSILKVATARPVDESEDEESSSMVLKINETLQSLERRMDRIDRELETLQSLERRMDVMHMELELLEKRTNKIQDKEQELERRADEAITTYGNNIQAIMLFHGLGSTYLQVNYTYVGMWISVSTIVSFFFAFTVAFIVTSNKVERMSQYGKNLQKRLREIQNQVSSFGANINTMANYDPELKILARSGAYGGVSDRMALFNRHVATLQKTTPKTLELFNSNRMKSLNQVAVVAIAYGLTFPVMTSYLLYLFGLRRMGLISWY